MSHPSSSKLKIVFKLKIVNWTVTITKSLKSSTVYTVQCSFVDCSQFHGIKFSSSECSFSDIVLQVGWFLFVGLMLVCGFGLSGLGCDDPSSSVGLGVSTAVGFAAGWFLVFGGVTLGCSLSLPLVLACGLAGVSDVFFMSTLLQR